MAPSATTSQSMSAKIKRPMNIQTNGLNSSASPSPSMSAGRLPGAPKYAPNSAKSNGIGGNNLGGRSATRPRRDGPAQLLGRGQRNSSVGLRSAGIAGEIVAPPVLEPRPYIISDAYILKKYRGNPPSLIVHLHTQHFRFDQQEGNFSYKSPMKIMIEHLKLRTIPHDLAEFFATSNVPYYEGCMIVQVIDHKSTAPSQSTSRADTRAGKTTPFSIHNSNPYLTPSPWVPYPNDNQNLKSKIPADNVDESGKSKTSEQKDKENMPAPAPPADGQRGKAPSLLKKPKVMTVVLHPTSISTYAERAAEARSNNVEGRVDVNGPLSATVPPTPVTAIPPPTPLTNMPPPAKRQKRAKAELDVNNFHSAESQMTLATAAPLILDSVGNAAESAALLKSLAHPMYSEKPPSPKTRKRTVAEVAADEAFAREQERFMLILDERLSTVGAQGGPSHADGDGQAGGASFEPRFERFKTLENIRNQHEENKKAEKARQVEVQRKEAQDKERERLRLEAEKKAADQSRHQALAQSRLNDQTRRAIAAQAGQHPQGLQGIPPQAQGQHSHPMANGNGVNGIQAQSQRFQQQQTSQAQTSSPVVRNGTPQNHSSPIVNNLGNIPMQLSTSSMGGSPPRPGSVVHQNHPQAAGAHAMVAQRSQQSHAGTPRMLNATPNVQATPRPMNQTPRMSQASPLHGPMAPAPNMPMMGQVPHQMTPQQQQQLLHHQQQQAQAQMAMRQNMQQQQQAQAQMGGMNMNQIGQNQQQFMMMRVAAQQQHQRQQLQQGQMANNPGQNMYAAQLQAMARQQQQQQGVGPVNPNMNFNGNGVPDMAAIRMQQQQMQAQQHAHAQAQAHGQVPQGNPQQMTPAQQMQNMIARQANIYYQSQLPTLKAQYPNGVPIDLLNQLKITCQQNASRQVQTNMRQRQMAFQAQQANMQQANMQAMNGGMMNGQQGM